jgi:hypothetical protein
MCESTKARLLWSLPNLAADDHADIAWAQSKIEQQFGRRNLRLHSASRYWGQRAKRGNGARLITRSGHMTKHNQSGDHFGTPVSSGRAMTNTTTTMKAKIRINLRSIERTLPWLVLVTFFEVRHLLTRGFAERRVQISQQEADVIAEQIACQWLSLFIRVACSA